MKGIYPLTDPIWKVTCCAETPTAERKGVKSLPSQTADWLILTHSLLRLPAYWANFSTWNAMELQSKHNSLDLKRPKSEIDNILI
jgi:hypothetical protein